MLILQVTYFVINLNVELYHFPQKVCIVPSYLEKYFEIKVDITKIIYINMSFIIFSNVI